MRRWDRDALFAFPCLRGEGLPDHPGAGTARDPSRQAHSGHKFYAPEQHQYTPARLGLVAQLSRAMEQHELVLHYQPKARLATGTVESVEALARWNHPLAPDQFDRWLAAYQQMFGAARLDDRPALKLR